MAVSDFKAGQQVEEEFAIKEKNLRDLRSGQGHYLSLVLADISGQTINNTIDNSKDRRLETIILRPNVTKNSGTHSFRRRYLI